MKFKIARLKRAQVFDSSGLADNLGSKSLRGGAATMGSQGVLFGLNLLRSIVLARLLVPADFGLVGMVTVLINFAGMFKDAGLSMATVQRKEINEAQISSLFWVNVLISLILGLLIFLSAPLVAEFYGKPLLKPITMALAVPFVLSGIQIQHLALLRRHMMFVQIAVINITATLCAVGVSILMAYWGYEYWALIGAMWAMSTASLLLTFFFCPWMPGRYRRGSGIRSMLVFGGHLTGFNLVNFFSRNLDNILIGRFLGANALGYYDRAYKLMMQPLQNLNGPLSAVGIPALSRVQDNRKRYCSYFERAGGLLLLITMPLAAFLTISSADLITVLFGSQWEASITPFRWLSLCIISQPLGSTVGWLYVTQGRTKDMMIWGFIGSAITIISIVLGLRWGINGVALCYALIGLVLVTPLSFWFAGRKGFVSSGSLFKIFFSKLPYLFGFGLLHILIRYLVNLTSLSHFYSLLIQGMAYGVGMVLVVLFAPDAKVIRDAGFKFLNRKFQTR